LVSKDAMLASQIRRWNNVKTQFIASHRSKYLNASQFARVLSFDTSKRFTIDK
jgi:hypothetical protein